MDTKGESEEKDVHDAEFLLAQMTLGDRRNSDDDVEPADEPPANLELPKEEHAITIGGSFGYNSVKRQRELKHALYFDVTSLERVPEEDGYRTAVSMLSAVAACAHDQLADSYQKGVFKVELVLSQGKATRPLTASATIRFSNAVRCRASAKLIEECHGKFDAFRFELNPEKCGEVSVLPDSSATMEGPLAAHDIKEPTPELEDDDEDGDYGQQNNTVVFEFNNPDKNFELHINIYNGVNFEENTREDAMRAVLQCVDHGLDELYRRGTIGVRLETKPAISDPRFAKATITFSDEIRFAEAINLANTLYGMDGRRGTIPQFRFERRATQ